MKINIFIAGYLIITMASTNVIAADCAGKFKTKYSASDGNSSINCLNKENQQRISETSTITADAVEIKKRLGQIEDKLTSNNKTSDGLVKQIDDLSTIVETFDDSIIQLQNDVNVLKGLPKIEPIKSIIVDEALQAEVTGLGKVTDTSTAQAYETASFKIKNISKNDIYLAFDSASGFVASDDHGISATTSQAIGIKSLSVNTGNGTAKSNYTVLTPGNSISISFSTGILTRDATNQLGNRFSLGFSLLENTDIVVANTTKDKIISLPFSFQNIVASQSKIPQ